MATEQENLGRVSSDGEEDSNTPWGFWATLGFAVLIIIAYSIAQMVVLPFFVSDLGHVNEKMLTTNGDLLSFATIASTIVLCLLTILFTSMRKNYATKIYLGFQWPTWRQFFFWLGVLIAFNLVALGLFYLLGLSVKSDVMITLYKNAHYAALFWITVVVAAPLSEEFFFRGFLLDGWRHSFMGVYGAVFLTALIWGSIHLQYPVHIIAMIVVMGIIFGLARVKTGSLYLVMILHGINNFASMLEMHFFYL